MTWHIYISAGTIKCFTCKSEGHTSKHCTAKNPNIINTNLQSAEDSESYSEITDEYRDVQKQALRCMEITVASKFPETKKINEVQSENYTENFKEENENDKINLQVTNTSTDTAKQEQNNFKSPSLILNKKRPLSAAGESVSTEQKSNKSIKNMKKKRKNYTTNEHGTCSLLTDLVVSWSYLVYTYISLYIMKL